MFFLPAHLQFPFAKISKGGEGGREARKEIKTHFCLAVKRGPGKKKISISKAAKIPAAAFPPKGCPHQQQARGLMVKIIVNFLRNILAWSWESPSFSSEQELRMASGGHKLKVSPVPFLGLFGGIWRILRAPVINFG